MKDVWVNRDSSYSWTSRRTVGGGGALVIEVTRKSKITLTELHRSHLEMEKVSDRQTLLPVQSIYFNTDGFWILTVSWRGISDFLFFSFFLKFMSFLKHLSFLFIFLRWCECFLYQLQRDNLSVSTCFWHILPLYCTLEYQVDLTAVQKTAVCGCVYGINRKYWGADVSDIAYCMNVLLMLY